MYRRPFKWGIRRPGDNGTFSDIACHPLLVNADQQDETVIDDLIAAAQKAMVLRAFVVLGIADHVTSEEANLADLSAAVGAPAESLQRLLRAAVPLGLCRDAGPGRVALTPAGAKLRSDAPGSAAGWAQLLTAPWLLRAWETLGPAVLTGQAQFPQVHGVGFWEYVATHPRDAGLFDAVMTSGSTERALTLHEALDWTDVQQVVDVGGGQGLLLKSLLNAVPHLHGVVLDRPEVVNSPGTDAVGRSDRLTLVAGDFLAEVPGGADLYVLSRIIHDWPDDEAAAILRSCRAAMKPGSRLCILEQVVPESAEATMSQQLELALTDLNMLVLVGGQERTLAEYSALLDRAGLDFDRIHNGSTCSVIVTAKAP